MNHITNKQGYARYYAVSYRHNKTFSVKWIFAESIAQVWSIFVEQYGHKAPSTERFDYIIL